MMMHPDIKPIVIPFPERLSDKIIKEVRIIPFDDGRHFRIHYVFEVTSEEKGLNKDNALAIDLGVNNLAACVSTVGTPFIMDGRKLKSINHQWNREKARLQSVAKKQGKDITSRINRITEKRNNRVRDIIRKTARHIADYCIAQDIGSVYVGYNPDFKQSTNLGDSNNQNFVQIPFGQFRQQLSFLCWKYGIDYIEQEESYTSKSSVLDRDELPVYDPKQQISGKFSGQRIHRGLYMSKNGTAINADVNGSANILRKGKQNLDFEKLCMGLLASPERIRVH
jgi:IS605 OrfB family transposase